MGKPPGLMDREGDVRYSFPAHSEHGMQRGVVPNRLQAVPQLEVLGGGGDDFDLMQRDDGLAPDLIQRQKELDRQRARQSVAADRDRELREFDMSAHRISRAVGQAASSRPVLVGEVGARITERDRALRQRQVRSRRAADENYDPQYAQQQGAVQGYRDVAFDGAVYSPAKKKVGGFFEEEIHEDDDMPEEGEDYTDAGGRAQEVHDEELLYYDREVAKMEHEVAQRTLKIQMLKTAVMDQPVISDDEDEDD